MTVVLSKKVVDISEPFGDQATDHRVELCNGSLPQSRPRVFTLNWSFCAMDVVEADDSRVKNATAIERSL